MRAIVAYRQGAELRRPLKRGRFDDAPVVEFLDRIRTSDGGVMANDVITPSGQTMLVRLLLAVLGIALLLIGWYRFIS